MSTFLLVVPPLTGHITPLVAVAEQLGLLGHRVVWSGDPAPIRELAGPTAVVHPALAGNVGAASRGADLRGYAAAQALWEDYLIPLAAATHESVAEAAKRFDADLVVADMQALAGPLAAARLGIPWATSASTSGSLGDMFAATPRIRQWLDGLFTDLIARLPGDAATTLTPATLERSPHLVLAFTTEALAGTVQVAGPPPAWIGPALRRQDRSQDDPKPANPFPWARLDARRPLITVSLGTVNNRVGGPFLRACAQALGQLGDRVQGVLADPLGAVDAVPDNVLTWGHLPMLALLPRTAAVVCHAGHNTVCEALTHDLPLVVAPIRDDQPVVAQQVVDAGAGIRLRFARATPDLIADAIVAVLREPGYGLAARRIGASFRRAGGAVAAADLLVRLVDAGTPVR
ncbi:UDP-glucuronosyltransferase [Frankia sp. R43]|uniref:glycosyltransferase n=1 Tax=Frankia sp. R43 TaxID=269536 RepID=UPI0006CA07B3|nr:glycosyltransferase [Frankia sp. R43]KPM52278.1 UDP-glucuronosyltransferase [Frankia sp. R43]